MEVINPKPEEASLIKRMVGDRGFALVNLGDRQAMIGILDGQDAQQVWDAILADPAEAARSRGSFRQQVTGQGVTLAQTKKKYLNK